jgi:molybdopterin-guanine dinucleotide biosynthesis protein A
VRRLGAIIAGGQSSRFGTDKALAMLDDRALLDHVADRLDTQCDAVIVCGRTWGDRVSVADRPTPGLGPLGGLCAALHYGAAHGFDMVVTAGCDTLPVPVIPGGGPDAAVVEGHYLFGQWPVALAPLLGAHLATTNDRSMRRWMTVSGARQIAVPATLHNLNTQADFRRYAQTQGLAA